MALALEGLLSQRTVRTWAARPRRQPSLDGPHADRQRFTLESESTPARTIPSQRHQGDSETSSRSQPYVRR